MTTGGEGGMVTTNDEALWRAMWSFKDHGKSYEAVYERRHPPGFRWVHESFGTNWRMLEIQAAIGRIQLRRLTEWTSLRQANAVALVKALQPFAGPDGPVLVPQLRCQGNSNNNSNLCTLGCGLGGVLSCERGCIHGQYKLYAYVRTQNLSPSFSRDSVIEAINAQGVPCYQGSCAEVYLEKAFDGTGWRPENRLPVAKELGETSLMFLVHPTLTDTEIQKTCNVIHEVFSQAKK
jgi:dTDP-4-amino-4,6-dideoxygalactose transaminase